MRMRVAGLPALMLLAASAGAAQEIPAGAHVLLRMVNSVSTRTAQPGDQVYLRTASPLTGGGRILVPVDSYVQGVVTMAKRAGRVRGRAQLAIRLETLTLPTGATLKFTSRVESVDAGESGQKVEKTENTIEQAPGKGADAAQVAILVGTGASIGALTDRSWRGTGIGAGVGAAVGLASVLLSRGNEVELSSGSSLDVVIDRVVALEQVQ